MRLGIGRWVLGLKHTWPHGAGRFPRDLGSGAVFKSAPAYYSLFSSGTSASAHSAPAIGVISTVGVQCVSQGSRRAGPDGHDVCVISLRSEDGTELISCDFLATWHVPPPRRHHLVATRSLPSNTRNTEQGPSYSCMHTAFGPKTLQKTRLGGGMAHYWCRPPPRRLSAALVRGIKRSTLSTS
ncbi:hypothetical protein CC85DRAFT_178748 [Cutaneotrichosporon oleaginosum]|uniref:Uncharacterized protein n=1 Tax=Cutaneotrichosporon oleaginosum TaxID=879819 RepID=A0A0J1AWP3_9TREE|nr:uncharacterized protein CC85DRAFT_178748 [Cutaneotrichosporon oleaginosum]KLT39719.1 hypothetical protein CC85DRAFT_178748 [Cutaneotrichosporon oleaginosum]TXT12269.1 hypothetical protein COLE_02679 [Cutaneotrichosporon oleaginosum]